MQIPTVEIIAFPDSNIKAKWYCATDFAAADETEPKYVKRIEHKEGPVEIIPLKNI